VRKVRHTPHWPVCQSSWWNIPSRVLHMSRKSIKSGTRKVDFTLTQPRIVTKSWHPSSSQSLINLRTNTRCAKQIISAGLISCVTPAKAHYEAHTSLLWIASTTLSISHAVYAQPSLVPRTHTTSTKVTCIATTTTQLSLRKSATDVRQRS
jgi:hypothetical protein